MKIIYIRTLRACLIFLFSFYASGLACNKSEIEQIFQDAENIDSIRAYFSEEEDCTLIMADISRGLFLITSDVGTMHIIFREVESYDKTTSITYEVSTGMSFSRSGEFFMAKDAHLLDFDARNNIFSILIQGARKEDNVYLRRKSDGTIHWSLLEFKERTSL